MLRRRVQSPKIDRSVFSGFRFPPEVILLAVRWYLRYGLSYRDVDELLAERGVVVDHVSVYRWVQRSALFSSTRPVPAVTAAVTAGSSTRPTSKSGADGCTCTGPLTSSGRSSTSSSPTNATCQPPGGSSSRRCHVRRVPSRSSPIGLPSTRRSSTRCY